MTNKRYTFVFLTVPAFGHINPMLIIIKELVRLSHNVVVYNNTEFKKIIENTGATFKPPPIKIVTPDFLEFRDNFRIAEINLNITKKIILPLIKAVRQDEPDCIIHDSLGLWGKLVARYLRVYSISLIPSMVIDFSSLFASGIRRDILFETIRKFPRFVRISREYSNIYKNLNLKAPIIFDIFSNKEEQNIVFTSRYLQINGNKFKSNYKFVGPSIYKRNQQLLSKKLFKSNKIIYISLGSIFNDRLKFYKTCIEAFKNSNYQVFVSIGNHINKSELGHVPDNIHVGNYLPQLQILSKAKLFITHGGMNSINESCYYGVPMILFPQMLEQKANAYRIEELGAGKHYKGDDITSEELLELSNKIIKEKRYKEGVRRIQVSLLKSGGYKEAVKTIISHLN